MTKAVCLRNISTRDLLNKVEPHACHLGTWVLKQGGLGSSDTYYFGEKCELK